MTLCEVTFNITTQAKKYYYYTDIEGLKRNDLLIVHANNDLSHAYFSKYIHENESVNMPISPIKWVIDKIDLDKYKEKLKLTEKKASIYINIQNEIAQIPKTKIYESIAKDNDNIAILLDCLKDLEK